jgi:crotonobetainyl-CoA:carnitine CoA-transferase CaiB-like acyl-CoA transferase
MLDRPLPVPRACFPFPLAPRPTPAAMSTEASPPPQPLPLADIRIVAIEQYGAGPFATLQLAALGAEVLKIEDPRVGGDVGRYVLPFAEAGESLFFETFNRNKRSLDLDVTNPAGREVLLDLVRHSDVVFSNLRGDVPEKLGITYAQLAHVNPKIVCCALTGYGTSGPRKAEPAYDYLIQGLAGWMSLTGEPGGPPTRTGLSLVDFATGFVAAIAILAGVHAARRDGIGMDCDVSLYETALHLTTYPATWMLTTGYATGRTSRSAHPSLVPFENFPTADGWLTIGCAKEKFFPRLAQALGHPEWATDPRFADFSARSAHREELEKLMDEVLQTRPATEWVELLVDAGVPAAPVLDLAHAFDDPQAVERKVVEKTDHPRFGTVSAVRPPARVGPVAPEPRRAPDRNEAFAYVLHDLLGKDASEVDGLRTAGAFGPLGDRGNEPAPGAHAE